MTTELMEKAGYDANNDKPWPSVAWPGCYPLEYILEDGESLCAGCMNTEDGVRIGVEPDGSGWTVVDVDVHWEGPAHTCAHCGADIESAYGDPDADDTNT